MKIIPDQHTWYSENKVGVVKQGQDGLLRRVHPTLDWFGYKKSKM